MLSVADGGNTLPLHNAVAPQSIACFPVVFCTWDTFGYARALNPAQIYWPPPHLQQMVIACVHSAV